MIRSIFLIYCVIIGLSFYSEAQSYSVKDNNTIVTSSVGSSVLGSDKDGILYLESIEGNIKVVNPIFGELLLEKKIKYKELKSNGFIPKFIEVINHQPYLFLENKDGYYSIVQIDKNLNPIGDLLKIGKKHSKLKSKDRFKFYYDLDRNEVGYFLTNKESFENNFILTLKGFDNKGNQLQDIDINIPVVLGGKLNFIAYDIDNYLILVNNYNYSKLFLVNKSGKVKQIKLDLNDKEKVALNATFIKRGENILIAGKIGEKENRNSKYIFAGVFSSKVDLESTSIEELDIEIFDKELVERSKIDVSSTVPPMFTTDYKLYKSLHTEDGGAVFFYQKTTSNIHVGEAVNNGTYYNYGPLVVFKVNKLGMVDWLNIVPIDQITINKDPGLGFVALEKNNEVFILHISSNIRQDFINKEIRKNYKYNYHDKKQEQIAITKVSSNETMRSTKVIDCTDEKFIFNPSYVYVDQNKYQFILFTEPKTQKKTSLIKIISI